MDWETTIIGMMFLLLCVIIFIFLSRHNSKKGKELLQTLKTSAGNPSLPIGRYDLWRHSVIGIDHTAGIIYSLRTINQQAVAVKVELAAIKSCQVINGTKTADASNGQFKETEKLDLVFTHKDKNKADLVIPFYNVAHDFSLNGELQLIEKWCRIANKELNIQQ